MRVHLGSDHAGLDLKNHLVGWLARAAATSRSTTARSSTTPQDDYPVFCLRAAEAVVADDPGSLGVVIGGSGNGEQIAANKVERRPLPRWPGARRRPRSPASTTTPTWSPSAAGCTRSRR